MLFFITNSFGKSINKYIDLLKKEDSLNNTEKALTYAHMSFEIIKKQKKVSVGDIANANTIGNFYFRNKQYNNAIVVYEFICKKNIREYGENNINYTSCLFSLTRSYEKSGDIFNTDSLYKKLLEIYKITLKKDDAEYLYTLDDYARFNFELGRYENAEKLFNECLSGYKTIFGSKSKRYGWTLNNLGNVYVKKNQSQEGEKYYLSCLSLYKEIYPPNHKEYILTLKNLIQLYRSEDELAKAEKMTEELYLIIKNGNSVNTLEFADFLEELFYLYLRLGQNDKALDLWDETYKIREELTGSESLEIAESNFSLGFGCLKEGANKEALTTFIRANKIVSKILDSTNVTNIKYKEGLAESYRVNGFLDSALAIYSKLQIDFHNTYNADPFRQAILNNNMASIYDDLGKYNKAEEGYLNSLSYFEKSKIQTNDYLIEGISNLLILYDKTKQFEKSLPLIQKVSKLLKEKAIKNISFLNEKNRVELIDYIKPRWDYISSFAVKYSENIPGLLKSIIENNLVYRNILFDNAKSMKNIINNSENPELRLKYEDLIIRKKYLAYAYSNPNIVSIKDSLLKSLEAEADSLEKLVSYMTASEYKNYKINIPDYDKIINVLGEDEAAIEFFTYYDFDTMGKMKTKYYGALILKKNLLNPIFIPFYDDETMQEVYLNYITSIKSRSIEIETYNRIWSKIEDKIGAVKVLYITNAGIFNKINLSSVFCPKTNTYLRDKYNLITLSSLRELPTKLKHSIKYNDAILFGNPKFNTESNLYSDSSFIALAHSSIFERITSNGKINELPATQIEIDNIDSVLKKKGIYCTSYSKNLATKNNLLSINSPSILHIATHGFFIENDSDNTYLTSLQKDKTYVNPYLKCGLLFSGCGAFINNVYSNNISDNGIITAADILNLDLTGTDLVVLSACQTGLGDVRDGEISYSLQRAFQIAGAKSVIMSMWNVDDLATQIFMTKFYDSLLSGKNKRDALKDAQDYLIAKTKYKSAKYWAPFVLTEL